MTKQTKKMLDWSLEQKVNDYIKLLKEKQKDGTLHKSFFELQCKLGHLVCHAEYIRRHDEIKKQNADATREMIRQEYPHYQKKRTSQKRTR